MCSPHLCQALVGALTFGTNVDKDGFNTSKTADNYLYVYAPCMYR